MEVLDCQKSRRSRPAVSRNCPPTTGPLSRVSYSIAMDICERIIKARDEGNSIVRIEVSAADSPEDAAERLGLWKTAAHHEISEEEAKGVLCAVLVEDMAYSSPIVPPSEARDLATAFILSFHDEDARYFTNAAWKSPRANSRNGNLDMSSW